MLAGSHFLMAKLAIMFSLLRLFLIRFWLQNTNSPIVIIILVFIACRHKTDKCHIKTILDFSHEQFFCTFDSLHSMFHLIPILDASRDGNKFILFYGFQNKGSCAYSAMRC